MKYLILILFLIPAQASCENWLAQAAYFEGRNQSIEGQVGICLTILNRVDSPKFPNTTRGVIKQYRQFSYQSDGKPETIHNPIAYKTAQRAAEISLWLRRNNFKGFGAMFYHASYVRPFWCHKMKRVAQIGSHIFYTK